MVEFPRHFGLQLRGQQIQQLPVRVAPRFADFSGGLVLSMHPGDQPPNTSPYAPNMEVSKAGRLRRAPGTALIEQFGGGRAPELFAVHGSLEFTAELIFFDPPYLGVRRDTNAAWADLGLRNRLDRYAWMNFGGIFIFTDGSKVYERKSNSGTSIRVLEEAPVASAYASWAGRAWAGGALIDGRFEPLGLAWSAANSIHSDWTGEGSGNELLINQIAAGDRIVALRPMGLDFMAIFLRNSIWVATRTGRVSRPGDFKPRVSGAGLAAWATARSTKYGIVYLTDDGVELFDGNTSVHLSDAIDTELVPLDYDQLPRYSASYDPTTFRYLLHTPQGVTWVYEMEKRRWFLRELDAYGSVVLPEQTAFVKWSDLAGSWENQDPLSWFDYGGASEGKANVIFLGDENGTSRAVAQESRAATTIWGQDFTAVWQVSSTIPELINYLLTMKQFNVEYKGSGNVEIWAPNIKGVQELVLEKTLDSEVNPEVDPITAWKTGRVAGMQIRLLSGTAEISALQILVQSRGPRLSTTPEAEPVQGEEVTSAVAVTNGEIRRCGLDAFVLITCGDSATLTIREVSLVSFLLTGAGGDAGADGAESGGSTIFWASLTGSPLNPAVDTPPEEYVALGGGRGGYGEEDGYPGGSGGGGGHQSPTISGATTRGGKAEGTNTNPGGAGHASQGLVQLKKAASGGGGGAGGPGTDGFIGEGGVPGLGGPGLFMPLWPVVALSPGGNGERLYVESTGGGGAIVGGGGGGGEIVEILDRTLPVGNFVVQVGAGADGQPGAGGHALSDVEGKCGLAVIKVRVQQQADGPADFSGGIVFSTALWKYAVFLNPGGVLSVLAAGWAEFVVIGAGGGGGSGVGGGGSAGGLCFGRVNLTHNVQVAIGLGGLGGTDGAAGLPGGPSSATMLNQELFSAPGGVGGTGAVQGGTPELGPSGGGGYGNGGLGGEAELARGNRGGDGLGFERAFDSVFVPWAGGGGGFGSRGEDGATEENEGDSYGETWDSTQAASASINLATQKLESGAVGVLDTRKEVSAGEMFVQCVIRRSGTIRVRIVARIQRLDSTPRGYALQLNTAGANFRGIYQLNDSMVGLNIADPGADFAVGVDHQVQFHVADSLQRASVGGTVMSAAHAGSNGAVDRTAGVQTVFAGGNTGQGIWDNFYVFRSTNLTVAGLPAGYRVQVLDILGNPVFPEATEVGGTATVDCYMGTDVQKRVPEATIPGQPPDGWKSLRVRDAGGAVVTTFSPGRIYPGAQLVFADGELQYVVTDEEPVTGLLAFDDFSGTIPGPTQGDGGAGLNLEEVLEETWADLDWVNAVGDFGPSVLAGGGGGSEGTVAGQGGEGGGGAGTAELATPGGDAVDGTGSGGGGSRESTVAGGKGGDGMVIFRVPV